MLAKRARICAIVETHSAPACTGPSHTKSGTQSLGIRLTRANGFSESTHCASSMAAGGGLPEVVATFPAALGSASRKTATHEACALVMSLIINQNDVQCKELCT